MKNMIISALVTYIYYSFCVIRNLFIPVVAFFLFLVIIAEIDELIEDYQKTVRKGQRLNRIIDEMKGVRF